MHVSKLFLAGAVLCLVGVLGAAEDKPDYAKLIVGKWEITKADAGTVPTGSVVEFTKDGKMKVQFKKGGEEATIDGTYKLEKNVIAMKLKVGDDEKSKEITITKISDKAMSTKDSDDKVVEMERKK